MKLRKEKAQELIEQEGTILDRLADLQTELVKVNAKLSARKDVLALTDDVIDLKKKIADLEIQESVLTEKHEREKREVQHFVGLEKNRQKMEIEHSKREATLTVREENLEADKERFEQHIAFVEKRMDTHLKDMKDLLTSVMDRIPTVNVDVQRGGE